MLSEVGIAASVALLSVLGGLFQGKVTERYKSSDYTASDLVALKTVFIKSKLFHCDAFQEQKISRQQPAKGLSHSF